ncbi:MAG: hypothetical protein ABSF37_05645 [Sedimentisphaerales bacterium]|jgi:hypothetical protein
MNKKVFWSKAIWPNDNIAEITCMGGWSMRGYANGFLEIASIASEKAIENKCAIDTIMPAILYNIRHSVELFLKFVLFEISEKSGHKITAEDHRIKDTFNKYKDLIRMFLETEHYMVAFSHEKWLNDFEGIINHVDAFDSDGQKTRYPTDKKGKPNLGGKAIVSTSDVYCLIEYIQSYYDEYNSRGT